ncbi:hypothetical protein ACFL6H_05315 [Candidatus Latescibacterota bacterium]
MYSDAEIVENNIVSLPKGRRNSFAKVREVILENIPPIGLLQYYRTINNNWGG